jgi:hypothetical protein
VRVARSALGCGRFLVAEKELRLLDRREVEVRMSAQRIVERGGSGLGRAHDEEVGQDEATTIRSHVVESVL